MEKLPDLVAAVTTEGTMSSLELSAEMHCGSCEQRVRRALGSLDGVRSVETDLKKQRVAVEFDDELVSESQLKTVVDRAGSHGMLDG